MSSLLAPDLRRILGELARRLDILERRIDPRAIQPSSSRHTHDGTGENSTVITGATNTDVVAVAPGEFATAGGDAAEANQDRGTAYGFAAVVDATGTGLDRGGTAIGDHAHSEGTDATAVGANSRAEADSAVVVGGGVSIFETTIVLGAGASSTNTNQVQLGTRFERTIQGVPNSAIADADLGIGQMSFYLNEAGNLLTVKVKYSGGTVNTGTMALT